MRWQVVPACLAPLLHPWFSPNSLSHGPPTIPVTLWRPHWAGRARFGPVTDPTDDEPRLGSASMWVLRAMSALVVATLAFFLIDAIVG